MTARKPFRSQWQPRDPAPRPEPVDSDHQKALRLPRPGPGIAISVPLHLWPIYAKIYRLQPAGILEPKVQPKYGPGQATLLVKKVKPEEKKK